MSATLSIQRLRLNFTGDTALKAAAGFWFSVLVAGQLVFASSVALFYGLTALHGDLHVWNKRLGNGYIEGDPIGNTALVAHIISAVLITLSGAIQFMPQIRRRVPAFHRWNGRIYIFTACSLSLAGLYMLWTRPTVGGLTGLVGNSILGVVVLVCAAMALRHAMRRDIVTHRRWAFRLFVALCSALFIRAGATLWGVIAIGAAGLDPATAIGTSLNVLSYAQYAFPLAVLELYFWTQRRGGGGAKLAMAAGLTVLTFGMGAGIATASAGIFLPSVQMALDRRPSIADTLDATIKNGGIDAAIAQYHRLQAVTPRVYNFDESELNTLGYTLLRRKQIKDAIRILQLNTESYPKSFNPWDSLGEAYMDDGNMPAAIANYRKSLQLNPANRNGVAMLAKIEGH